LSREELIDVGILIGTDFNPNGFERIGPKTAMKLIKQHSRLEDIPQIQEQLEEIDFPTNKEDISKSRSCRR
jgi:5''-3'' exonuclease (including N-terminal domain of PolI)